VAPTFLEFPLVDEEHDREYDVLVASTVFFSVAQRIRLPPGVWYSLRDEPVEGEVVMSGKLDVVLAFFREGKIVPTLTEVGRSSQLCLDMNLTLLVYGEEASGEIYIDDYDTVSHEQGNWVHRVLSYRNRRFACAAGETSGVAAQGVPIRVCDTVVVVGRGGVQRRQVSLVLNDDWEI
jgi:hypothetical protein